MKSSVKNLRAQLTPGIALMLAAMALSVLSNLFVIVGTYRLMGAEVLAPNTGQILTSYESFLRIAWIVNGTLFAIGFALVARDYLRRKRK